MNPDESFKNQEPPKNGSDGRKVSQELDKSLPAAEATFLAARSRKESRCLDILVVGMCPPATRSHVAGENLAAWKSARGKRKLCHVPRIFLVESVCVSENRYATETPLR